MSRLPSRSTPFPTRRSSELRLPLVPRNGCGRPGRAPERFLPLDITSLLLHVIFDARFLLRSSERFSRNAETEVHLVCRLLLEKNDRTRTSTRINTSTSNA